MRGEFSELVRYLSMFFYVLLLANSTRIFSCYPVIMVKF